jgi:c-di-GMP-binding flagellar brake protein YcgR
MKLKYRGIEKRRFDRVGTNFIAVCRLRKAVSVTMAADEEDIDALMLDLSEGGLALSIDHKVPKSTCFLVKFILVHSNTYTRKDFSPIQIEGKVRSCVPTKDKRYRLGVSFTEITEADKKSIIKFIEDMSKR